MNISKQLGNWTIEPSGDGKVHYLTSPDSCLQIGVDTDDYELDTEKELMLLLQILACGWPKKPKWEKITGPSALLLP